LADEITALSLRAIAQVFDLPANAEENYNNLMNDVALAVSEGSTMTTEEKTEFLSEKMETVLDDYGVEVDIEAAKNIAVGIVEDLGGVENVSAEDVEEFFLIYAMAAENNAQSGTTSKAYGEAKLMNATASAKVVLLNGTEKNEGTKKFDVVIDADGKLIVNGRMLKNYTAADYKNSAAYKSGAEGKNFGGGATLSSPETMKSSRVTVENIVSSIGSYADCEDIDSEAEAIQSLVVDAVNSFTGIEMNKDAVSQIVSGAGQLLDGVSNTVSIGQQAAGQLLTGILQSNKISGSLGVSVSDATKVAESINEKANKDDFDYSHATDAIAGTIDAITSASDEAKTSEEKLDATKGMIENMTPDSAEVLGVMATPEMMKNYGVPEKNAEAVSNAVSTMFDHMGDYNVGDANDAEQFEKEAEAIDKMFQLVMNSYNAGAANLFAANGEEGKINVSASELVSLAMESEVISKTVDEIIYGDGTYNGNPLNIPELTESDSKQVRDAINAYYAANGSTPEVGRKLRAIAGFLNIDINF